MNWYKNLKIKFKFIISFTIISLLVLFSGVVSLRAINNITKEFKDAITINKGIVEYGVNAMEEVTNLRIKALNNINWVTNDNVDDIKQELKDAHDIGRQRMEEYLALLEADKRGISRQNEIDIVHSIISLLNEYYLGYLDIIDFKLSGDNEKFLEVDKALTNVGNELFKKIYTMPTVSFKILDKAIIDTESHANTKEIQYMIIFCIVQGIIIFSAIKLTLNIKNPIEKLKNIAIKVSKGDLSDSSRTNARDEIADLFNAFADTSDNIQYILNDVNNLSKELEKGNISCRIDVSKYAYSFKDVTEAINKAVNTLIEDSLYIIDRLKDFGNGNFNVEIKEFLGEKIVIKEGITTVQTSIRNIFTDVDRLIDSANNGDLEFRLDTSTYVGQWKDTVDGLNQFVENVVSPIKETQNALNQFSLGNFTYRVTNEYRGEFNNIKQILNYTAETVGSYISEISDILKEMSNKNFDVSIDREYVGDFKQIQMSVNLIVNNLNLLTKDIIASAEQVSIGAKQISQSSVTLAEGATEQAAAVEELTATVSIISKQSRDNVLSAEKANELASKARNSANDGSRQMNDMLIAMEEINNASSGISNIIKVIDDIAFQTNILALNAAVEAARAGEHGKGFAVVAEEVRSLAARSQQAAKETTQLIESSVQKVSEGSKIANNTSESLINIVTQIEEISNLTTSCAVSSREQEASINQITEGISQIATVTQNNTATSEEAASASEELSSQSEVFYTSVSDFNLKQE